MASTKKYISNRKKKSFKKRIPKLLAETSSISKDNHSSSYGAKGNTFRALRGFRRAPSKVFREWAESVTDKLDTKQVKSDIGTRAGFIKWHKKLARSLNRYWRIKQRRSLSLAHKYKLIDLYIKWISKHDFLDRPTARLLVKNANCALDSQVLKMLNKCYSGALPIGVPTMGNITNQNTYDFCQELIFDFVGPCGGTRLLFDRYAYKRGNK